MLNQFVCGLGGKVFHASVQQLMPLFRDCMQCDADESELAVNLEFFDQVGIIMYSHADRNLVILDPMWLIDYLCRIVRNPKLHKIVLDPVGPLTIEEDLHHQLFNEGFLSGGCVSALWRDLSEEQRDRILQLAVRMRLFLPFQRGDVEGWIVPALLPAGPLRCTVDEESKNTRVYLAFTANMWESNSVASVTSVRDRSHLPAGLFEHLLSRLVSLEQNPDSWPELSKSHARLNSGQHVIELRVDHETNCILLTFRANHAQYHRAIDRLYQVKQN